jgi:hypothetical protein
MVELLYPCGVLRIASMFPAEGWRGGEVSIGGTK